MIALRWLAIAIAVAAIWDPAVRASRARGPALDVIVSVAQRKAAAAADVERQVRRALTASGFQIDTGDAPVARVAVADRPLTASDEVPVWAVDMSQPPPNVALRRAVAVGGPPGQSAEIRVDVEGTGVVADTTRISLDQNGITVATAQHTWESPFERWTAVFHYLSPTEAATVVVARAVPLPREATADDNVLDIQLPARRTPIRVLTWDASLSWGTAFIRRSLEGEPAFALGGLQRSSQGIATRAGAPPAALVSSTLAPYEVVVIGSPEELAPREIDALRWFLDERGGVVAFVPQRRPTGPYASLLGEGTFEERVLEQPVGLDTSAGERLDASELLVARRLPVTARTLAAFGRSAEPVIFTLRRGAGAVIFSGALDAWRYRAADRQAFARFWRRSLSEAALAVPPRLAVEVNPELVRVGDTAIVRARLRSSELQGSSGTFTAGPISARVVGPAQHVDDVLRLWPAAEPGVFEGTWIVPAAGAYDVAVSHGDAAADAQITALADDRRGADDDPEGLALLVRTSGGELLPANHIAELTARLTSRFPAQATEGRSHPMRSPWWVLPFALTLCAEWTWRRLRGGK